MITNNKIIEITDEQVSITMLDTFDRKQIVSKVYSMKNGSRELKEIDFVDDWSVEEKHQIVQEYFINFENKSYYSSAIYLEDEIAGFMVLDCNPIGENNEYAQLKMLHVSRNHRNKGMGKRLFLDAVRKARECGFAKLYISAHCSYETQKFYEICGCVDASWIYSKAVDLEPFDLQLEYDLTK